MPRPITRRERPYRDPRTNEPELTLVVSVLLENRKRFVLAQAPVGGGDLIVVADSSGAIPVFDTEHAADAYSARVFPLRPEDADSADAAVAAYAEVLAASEPTHLDLDAARAWAATPSAGDAGPVELALAWELLAGADAAPALASFDPMSMVGLQQDASRERPDSAESTTLLLGMKLNGMVAEIRRKHGADGGRSEWPVWMEEFWTSDDRARLADIIRLGVENFARRLSREAATRDVTTTWQRSQ
jgi:hypothetical protein